MIATPTPCKQPKVTLQPVTDSDLWASACRVPGCTWTYGPGLKTDVEEQTRWHRRDHRSAVPKVEVVWSSDLMRYVDQCGCGWTTPAGHVTATDRTAAVISHLHSQHGLVTC